MHLAQKIADGNKAYSEKVDRSKYGRQFVNTPQQFTVEDVDTELKPRKWASLYTDAAFYYDNPTVDQERLMKKKL